MLKFFNSTFEWDKRVFIFIFIFVCASEALIFMTPVETLFATEYRRMIFSRVVVILMTVLALLHLYPKRKEIFVYLKEFFLEPAHPVNLAILRVVLFSHLFLAQPENKLVWYSQLPEIFHFPPTGTEWILKYLPINELSIIWACKLFKLFCLFAVIGLCTNFSVTLVAVLGLYVYGIPNIFGKVHHDHYLVWFPMILAASPCGHMLSVDGIINAIKRANRGQIVSLKVDMGVDWNYLFFPGLLEDLGCWF